MSKIPDEVLQELATNLARLRPKDPERRKLIERTASIFNCSIKTVHRQLTRLRGPRKYTRSDHGYPRGRTEADFKHWVELVAAVKLATRNQKGRHLSTARAIEMVEEGVYIDERFEQAPKGVLESVRFRGVRQRRFALVAENRDTKRGKSHPTPR